MALRGRRVSNGGHSPWSNGQTEGQITKLKLVKRQMYVAENSNSFRRECSALIDHGCTNIASEPHLDADLECALRVGQVEALRIG